MERSVRGARFLIAIAALAATAGSATAQVSSIFLDQWDLGYRSSRNSARIDALAGVWAALEDESREINMWDYGGNVAGFLDDRDAWSGDFWAATRDVDRRASGAGSSGEVTESGLQLSFRSYERALGLEGNLTVGADDRGGASGERHKFSGPRVSVIGNQTIGERFVFGAALRFVNEEEKITSRDPLAVEHDTSRTDFSLGLLYYLGAKLDIGVSATLTRNRIEGSSEDGLHRDRFEWDRPSAELGAQIIYGAQSALQGGAFIRRSSLDGGEELEISWSREFFLNPSGVDLSIRVPLLTEELTETEMGTRWLVEISELIDVGAAASYLTGEYDATANPTFPSIVSTSDEEFDETTLNAGIAFHPLSRLALAGQIDVGERNEDAVVLDAIQTEKVSVTSVGAGLEFFLRPDLALRGGVRLGTRTDELTAAGVTTSMDTDLQTISGGVGWAPRGGILLLDAAVAFSDGELQDSSVTDETSGLAFTVTGRTLFR